MSEQSFREIQLSGKQLVFLFMASVVVAVSIFLLGISVGRGLRPGTTAAVGTTAVDLAPEKDQSAPAVMPPPTEVTPADRAYHDQLQGQVTPPAAALPSLAAASGNDAATAPPEPVGDGATTGTEAKSPTPAAAKTVKMPRQSHKYDSGDERAGGHWQERRPGRNGGRARIDDGREQARAAWRRLVRTGRRVQVARECGPSGGAAESERVHRRCARDLVEVRPLSCTCRSSGRSIGSPARGGAN